MPGWHICCTRADCWNRQQRQVNAVLAGRSFNGKNFFLPRLLLNFVLRPVLQEFEYQYVIRLVQPLNGYRG